ncbi:MAG: pyridoxal phosphate-dependent aminotransferase [Myxococcota bacterium]
MTVECARVGGVNLAQGVCDTPVPEVVRRAAQAAIEEGANSYSRYDGLEELRRALGAKMKRDNGLDYDPEGEILVTSGATGAFYVVALGLLDPGDEVILFEPYYGYHLDTLWALEVEPVYVSLPRPDWRFRVRDLEAAITPRTRAVVINTPVNPSGKVFRRAELEELGDVAERHDLFLFTDEVYEHFVFDGCEHISPASLPGLRERTITMNAVSKTFCVTGWRIGWVAADRRWAQHFGPLNDLVYVCPPTPLQLGAARALEQLGPEYYAGIAREYQPKRDRLCAALERAGLAPHVPDGSYFALADISRLPGDTGEARTMHLLQQTGVAAVPGEAFYHGDEGHEVARFCFGKTDEDLDEACRRLEKL